MESLHTALNSLLKALCCGDTEGVLAVMRPEPRTNGRRWTPAEIAAWRSHQTLWLRPDWDAPQHALAELRRKRRERQSVV